MNDKPTTRKPSLWAVDFFSVRTVTARGLKDMYVLVCLSMTNCEMIVSQSKLHPNWTWGSNLKTSPFLRGRERQRESFRNHPAAYSGFLGSRTHG